MDYYDWGGVSFLVISVGVLLKAISLDLKLQASLRASNSKFNPMDLYFLEPTCHWHLIPAQWKYSHKIKHSKFGTLSFNLFSLKTLLRIPDRLSELPREIIDIILSASNPRPNIMHSTSHPQVQFTTKTVIKNTAMLCRRWRCAWTICSKLTFRRDDFRSNQSFIRFVNRTLALRGQSPLATFEIYWTNGTVDIDCISTWLYYAMHCDVQEIVLYVHSLNSLMLTPCLFRCPSLKVLDIVAAQTPRRLRPFLKLPTSINLKNLRCLDLQFVRCSHQLLQKLISSSIFLESLKLGAFNGSIKIAAPNLKTLHLYCTKGSVEICAPKLESLVCNLYSLAAISTEDFKFLIDAYVGYYYRKPKGSIYKLVKFMKRVRNVEVLNLKGDVFESLSKLDLSEQIFPMFYNLKNLSIRTSLATKNINVIIMLLQRCPTLEKLVLYNTKSGHCPLDASEDYQVPWQLEDDRGFPRLTDIVISRFFGKKVEFQLVKFFLQEAKALQKMYVNGVLPPSRCRSVIYKKLHAFHKASSNAKVLITDDVLQ